MTCLQVKHKKKKKKKKKKRKKEKCCVIPASFFQYYMLTQICTYETESVVYLVKSILMQILLTGTFFSRHFLSFSLLS